MTEKEADISIAASNSLDFLNEVNVKSYVGHGDDVTCCAFSTNLKLLVTGADDCKVRLWDIDKDELLHTFDDHEGPVKCCCFSSDSSMIASGGFDHFVFVWQSDSGELLHKFQGQTSSIETVAFSPCGQLLCSGSWDKTAVVWDLKTKVPRIIIEGHKSVVQCCAFSVTGVYLATGSWDYTIQVLNVVHHGQRHRCVLNGHTSNVKSLAFSCQDLLASASWDCTVRLWDIMKGECLTVFEGHEGWVQTCAFSPDGSYVVSAADDKTVRMWCTKTGTCIKQLEMLFTGQMTILGSYQQDFKKTNTKSQGPNNFTPDFFATDPVSH